MSSLAITVPEWTRLDPEQDGRLAGFTFSNNLWSRQLARQFTETGRLEILELANGLLIRTNSYVGNIDLGPLRLTIQPKIAGMPLLNLLRYAYGLRNLDLFTPSGQAVGDSTFQDLLIHQLAAEAQELLARGLHRTYVGTRERLASPRGRLDFPDYARHGGTAVAGLPCIHHPRLQNTPVNRVLMSGLYFAAKLTADLVLRTRLRRLAQLMANDVETVRLDWHTIAEAWRAIDRRTVAYEPAVTLVAVLLEASGILLEEEPAQVRVPGFLFNMNLFFQALLSRFLRENLPGFTVEDEKGLKDMLAYSQNPKKWRSPVPRPDYVLYREGRVFGILDAKYMDLWANGPPRDILYQLTMYALSQGIGSQATILYSTLSPEAREAALDVRDPVYGTRQARIFLRPVDLLRLERLISAPDNIHSERDRRSYAQYLAFGAQKAQ